MLLLLQGLFNSSNEYSCDYYRFENCCCFVRNFCCCCCCYYCITWDVLKCCRIFAQIFDRKNIRKFKRLPIARLEERQAGSRLFGWYMANGPAIGLDYFVAFVEIWVYDYEFLEETFQIVNALIGLSEKYTSCFVFFLLRKILHIFECCLGLFCFIWSFEWLQRLC